MANLKEVKNRIQSVTSTQQITSAMKMVAAAKLKRAQDRITQMRPYSQKLTGILQNVSSALDGDIENAFGETREVENVLLVVVSSDRGLCGAFNNNIFKAAVNLINDKYSYEQKHDGVHILPIGKKAFEYFSKRKYSVVDDYYDMFQDLTFDKVKKAAEFAMEEFREGNYDKVELVFNEFKNVATQIVRTEEFLPLQSVVPKDGEAKKKDVDYLFEPSAQYVVNELIPKSLKIQFYKAVLESNASEHGARMTAMGQATDNAGDLLKQLKLTYNRTRQAAITKEILEIVGGAEALASNS
ncbi:ATP synthase F1 subunit gamma [Reichenbachiella agariperforans]|uniref:ATP synthase gamma chain n=1 Tax=Reichenbachiella agariperforans TaxID=156994 RepID=A0A1M6WRL1_REIAG|nr:ATP synthase F1 subunit gamma [Reichenbachiella agariperforans]MBU2914788.1 ATP synthase F1 subunit gamma [Reichenbachiella agariperforans]SHK96306.1 ATP synthase F1 subcomplex gamma subunit [Reichenbachiella agariperforans]